MGATLEACSTFLSSACALVAWKDSSSPNAALYWPVISANVPMPRIKACPVPVKNPPVCLVSSAGTAVSVVEVSVKEELR